MAIKISLRLLTYLQVGLVGHNIKIIIDHEASLDTKFRKLELSTIHNSTFTGDHNSNSVCLMHILGSSQPDLHSSQSSKYKTVIDVYLV